MPRSAPSYFLLAWALSGCQPAAVYYPKPVGAPAGWESVCAEAVAATVTVENNRSVAAEVHELLPVQCEPSLRGTVVGGESADLGEAVGTVWRAYDAETREVIGDFFLVEGENVLVLD